VLALEVARGLLIARLFVAMSAFAQPHGIELDESLEFMRLLWSIEHLLRSTSNLMHRQSGLTGPQRLVLRVVHQHPGISPSEIVRLIHLHKSTAAGILRRLERKGLIVRDRDPSDKRHTTLRTVPGSVPGQPSTLESVVARVLAHLSHGERHAARRALTQIVEALREQVDSMRRRDVRHFTRLHSHER
jgi:MarR family transcriptional regulator, organic hydroperoxide resistance regulator